MLSGFGDSLAIKQTTSDDEDPGGEKGARIHDKAIVRSLTATGRWGTTPTRGSVLRFAVEGSRRDRGILVSTFAQFATASSAQEIVSLGDDCCFTMEVGAADRYLIRSLSLHADDTSVGHPITNAPFLAGGVLTNTRAAAGINVWTAQQGITVAGSATYDLTQSIDESRNATLSRLLGTSSKIMDTPTGGAVLAEYGDISFGGGMALMAVDGEPLDAMVSNLGQADNSYKTVDSTTSQVSQGFTTGSNSSGYWLQGIGVNIEGSSGKDPDGPSSVSVAVYTDDNGEPGDKLFDLVSPATFFSTSPNYSEAPLDTWLAPNTSYVMVWSHLGGTAHRLQQTLSDNEDSDALTGFSIANAFHSGADLTSLSISSGGNSLEIVLYGGAIGDEPPNQMVANLGQANARVTDPNDANKTIPDHIEVVAATLKVVSQGFTTGSYQAGYRLQGIGVNIEGSDDANGDPQIPDAASSVTVAVHADANGKPGDKLFDLVSPAEFSAGSASFFEAPPEAKLSANTSYVVVWRYLSGTKHRLQPTASDSEDSSAFGGFSVADSVYHGAAVNNLSANTDGYALEIAVYGDYNLGGAGGYQVTPNWLHIPDDVEVGDQFRLVFVSTTDHSTNPMSADIEDYNAVVQREAAREYNHSIIRRVAPEFKAVVCTKTVDARRNTGMTDSQGVPVHWLDGGHDDRPTLIADSYDEFYGGEWLDREWGALSTGNSALFGEHTLIWTGCDATGAAHPDAHIGTTSPMGMVALGTPNHTSSKFGPLGAIFVADGYLSADMEQSHRLYAVSPVFTVVPRR